jgi:hypothetical protein
MLIPDNIEFNYYTVLSRASSLMIRQNSILMAQLTKPDVLIDIQSADESRVDQLNILDIIIQVPASAISIVFIVGDTGTEPHRHKAARKDGNQHP